MSPAAASTSPAAAWFPAWPSPLLPGLYRRGDNAANHFPSPVFLKAWLPHLLPQHHLGAFFKMQIPGSHPRISEAGPRKLHSDKQPRHVSCTLNPENQG